MTEYCTFCGKSNDEVEVMVTEPNSRASICLHCANIAHDCCCAYVLLKHRREADREESLRWAEFAP